MTAVQFRKLALQVPGAVEAAHMGHPDFRLNGKIFATLGFPNETRAMVKLTPMQQDELIKSAPTVFEPCAGAWGRGGSTSVHLGAAKVSVLRTALTTAAENISTRKR